MYNYGTNRMLRIATILEWLEYCYESDSDDGDGNPLGLTITCLAKALKVPIITIREDIYELATYPNRRRIIYSVDYYKMKSQLYKDDEIVCVDMKRDPPNTRTMVFEYCSKKGDDSKLQYASGKPVSFRKLIKDGYFDDVPIRSEFLADLNQNPVNRFGLVLQDEEMGILREFAAQNDLDLNLAGKRSVYFKSLRSVSDTDISRLEKIMKSLCLEHEPGQEKKIRFYYDSPAIGRGWKVVVPLLIEQDLDTGFLYLIAEGKNPGQHGARFRLDRMVPFDKIEEVGAEHQFERKGGTKGQFFTEVNIEEAEREDYPQEFTHVRIKVFDRHGYDIHSRVIRDLERKHIGDRAYSIDDHMKQIKDKKGDYYIYEDDVSDVRKLKSWVYSYGSSMVVLEPESLREEVIASYRKRSEYYKSLNETAQ